MKDNSFSGKQYGTYPGFLTRLEQVNPAYRTLSILDWPPLHTQGHLAGRPTYSNEEWLMKVS